MIGEGNPSRQIAIIGAGVIGLQIAVTLLEEGYAVVIIADQYPRSTSKYYTSPWAGAQWRSHSAPDDFGQQAWDRETYLHWDRICRDETARGATLNEKSGLVKYPAKLIYDNHDHADLAPSGDAKTSDGFWFRDFVEGFQAESSSDDTTVPYATVEYRSIFIDVPLYLAYLMNQVRKLGGLIIEATLPTENGLAGAVDAAGVVTKQHFDLELTAQDIFINATGLRAGELCRDSAVYPVRGQVLLVRGVPRQAISRIAREERTREWCVSYVIPRPLSDTTILGGCQQKHNWNGKEDPEVTAEIKERCAKLVPELLTGRDGSFEVLACEVGLRPARHGGARVEKEAIRVNGGLKRWVVHAYGHGGAGYQNSVGVARKVSEIISTLEDKLIFKL